MAVRGQSEGSDFSPSTRSVKPEDRTREVAGLGCRRLCSRGHPPSPIIIYFARFRTGLELSIPDLPLRSLTGPDPPRGVGSALPAPHLRPSRPRPLTSRCARALPALPAQRRAGRSRRLGSPGDCFCLLLSYGAGRDPRRRLAPGLECGSLLSAAPVGAERAMGEPDPLVSGQLAAGRSWCLRRLGMDREWLQLEAASEVRACGLGVRGAAGAAGAAGSGRLGGAAPRRPGLRGGTRSGRGVGPPQGLAGPGREARRGRGLRGPGLVDGWLRGSEAPCQSRRNGRGALRE